MNGAWGDVTFPTGQARRYELAQAPITNIRRIAPVGNGGRE